MDIKEFQDKETDKAYLEYLSTIDWGAAKMLYKTLSTDTYYEKFGESSRPFYAVEGDNFVGFFNLTEKDYIEVAEYDKFISMLYVDPNYRDRHLSQAFITAAEAYLLSEGEKEAHLMTQHEGLYEKYGYEKVRELPDGPHDMDYLYTKTIVG